MPIIYDRIPGGYLIGLRTGRCTEADTRRRTANFMDRIMRGLPVLERDRCWTLVTPHDLIVHGYCLNEPRTRDEAEWRHCPVAPLRKEDNLAEQDKAAGADHGSRVALEILRQEGRNSAEGGARIQCVRQGYEETVQGDEGHVQADPAQKAMTGARLP